MTSHKVIEISHLSYDYPDGTPALKDIHLEIYEHESIAILGPNGAGKSTLLYHLNGTLMGNGKVIILGIPVKKENLKEIRSKVGLVFQSREDQLFCPTVFDDLAFGPLNMGLDEDGTALGLLPSRALSSAQAESIVVRCSRPEEDVLRNDGGDQQQMKIRQRLFDPSGYRVARDPSRTSQLEARPWMRRLRGNATISASQHDALNGVAVTARNSHQINQRLPQPGRAAHRHGEWYLAKECVGSNRGLTRTIATSRSDDDRAESD